MESLWREQTKKIVPKKVAVEQGMETGGIWDVIVVGAGMSGVLIAYYLKEQGKKVLVLEADRIAGGQTEKTTAKITSQHGLLYHDLIKNVGARKAGWYAEANESAIREYGRLIKEKEMDCGFEKAPAYLYSTKKGAEERLKKEAKAAFDLGIDAFFTTDTELPFPITAAVCFRNQAKFEPLKFIRILAKELTIIEHSKVLKIKGCQVITKDMTYLARKIVVATHYPFINVPGFYFLRQHQERSYVLALSGCEKIKGMYLGIDEEGLSFRQEGEWMLLGGRTHRTGKIQCAGAYEKLYKTAKKHYPMCKEVTRWSAQDCMPHDKIPFIGKYSMLTPNLYVVTGFKKWGMTSSMIAAQLIRDEICGIHNPYKKLFTPQRINFRAGIGNLLADICESTKDLFEGWVLRNKPRCPHMGCGLKWNNEEESWDCPCHGSRFDKKGMLLDNPSQHSLK